MKKIGIMSMQRIINYGSYLQAWGMKSLLEELGYSDIEFIDYKYERAVVNPKRRTLWERIKKNINIISYIKMKRHQKKFIDTYNNEYLPKLINIDKFNYNKNIDTLIIGSDEVFNCLQGYPVGFSKNLFGEGYEKSKVISYAASFGFVKLEKLEEYGIDKEVGKLLKAFASISVRDENSCEIVKKLTEKKPEINLDPVLVANFPYRNPQIDINNYIIVYAYPGRLTREEQREIKKIAQKKRKENNKHR